MTMNLRIEGGKDLEAALMALASTTARRTARKAMAAALQPVLSAAKGAAPVGPTGNLRASVGVGHKLTPSQAREAGRESRDVAIMYVGAAAPHAHLVEFGTGPRHHKSGKFVGAMPPNPWMRPAWDGNRDAVLAGLSEALAAQIAATVARVAKRKANAARKAAGGRG